MRQRLLDDLTGVATQHRNRLLARMQVAPDQSHLGLLQPERSEHGRRTVYAGRLKADVVMTSMFMRVNSKRAHQVRPPSGLAGARQLLKPFGSFLATGGRLGWDEVSQEVDRREGYFG